MSRRGPVVLVLVLLVAGCDAGTPSAPVAGSSDPTSPAVDVSDPAVRDALYLTAVDDVLAGTAYEGMVDEAPGDFLQAADGVCRRLDDGDDPDRLLTDVLDAIGGTRIPIGDDDALLAGAVLGAGVQVYCPEHAGSLPEEARTP